jgi:hypothetical protein
MKHYRSSESGHSSEGSRYRRGYDDANQRPGSHRERNVAWRDEDPEEPRTYGRGDEDWWRARERLGVRDDALLDYGAPQYGAFGFAAGGPLGRDWRAIGDGDGTGAGRGQRGGHWGKGPKGYTRSDDRICEDVCDRLSDDDQVDASDISVSVSNGEVTLEGSVSDRRAKHRAEDLADAVSGVSDVHNRLRKNKGMLQDMSDKLRGDDQREHGHAGSGTKTHPSASRV